MKPTEEAVVDEMTVASVMTTQVVTAQPAAPFRELVATMAPGTVEVRVTAGVATVDGSVEHRTTAQVAAQLTHAVPGVVDVRDT